MMGGGGVGAPRVVTGLLFYFFFDTRMLENEVLYPCFGVSRSPSYPHCKHTLFIHTSSVHYYMNPTLH
jgi:hypothetical protein